MNLLIAGGAGYLGSALIPKLLERGYSVDVVDLFWFGNHLPREARVLSKDIFSLQASDLEGYDQVVFLAGLSNDPMAEYAPSKNFIFNAAAPAFLAYIAKRAGVRRYVYASSCSVYGYTENELFDETRPAFSAYPYGISKLQGEYAVTNLADQDFSVISLRKGTASGYSPRMRLDLLINTMFKCAMQVGEITVNNPSIWRPIVSIDDATSAYIRAIEAHERTSGIFNIAFGNYTVGEVADQVKSEIEEQLGTRIKLNIRHDRDVRNYKVSCEKARTVLSFQPRHDPRSVVRDLIVNAEKFSDWENPLYYNIRTFQSLEAREAHATTPKVSALATGAAD